MRLSVQHVLYGVGLDLLIGDPEWLPHPIRGLGWVINKSEDFWRGTRLPLRLSGSFFTCTIVGIATACVSLTLPSLTTFWIFTLLAIRSLDMESTKVISALQQGNLCQARHYLSRIVGRDTAALNKEEIVRATIETIAENVSDGIVAPLFYLTVAGPAGMAAYKAVNTLDSMVGYRNERYRDFGWASARLDDIANFIPARVTAGLISLSAPIVGGSIGRSVEIALRDARHQPSPNAGYPEAAMAGALGIQLGGLNFYNGAPSRKAHLGDADKPITISAFRAARRLLFATAFLGVALVCRFRR